MITRGKRYRLKTPTVTLVRENGKATATTMPEGSIVEVMPELAEIGRLLQIRWESKDCEMFTVDLRERGEEIKD
jgi:hypothetical protein